MWKVDFFAIKNHNMTYLNFEHDFVDLHVGIGPVTYTWKIKCHSRAPAGLVRISNLYHVFVFVYLWFEFLLLMMMCIQIYIYIHIYILLSFASEQIRWYLDMDAAIIIWLSGQWQYLKGKDSVGDTASFHWTIWKGTGYHVRYLTSPSPFVARSSAPYEPLLVCFFLVALCGKNWCVIDMFQLHSYT